MDSGHLKVACSVPRAIKGTSALNCKYSLSSSLCLGPRRFAEGPGAVSRRWIFAYFAAHNHKPPRCGSDHAAAQWQRVQNPDNDARICSAKPIARHANAMKGVPDRETSHGVAAVV
eukprot:6196513-Pleurochrysis_carterae.AAC.4